MDLDVEHLTYAEVMNRIAKVRCACRTLDDAVLCARLRWGHAAWETESDAMGAVARCDCDCHEIWAAWARASDEDE